MNLEKALLENLAEWRPYGPREALSVAPADSGWKIALTAEAVDALAATWWEVGLTRTAPFPAHSLKDRAERIAGRVTGLLEPLRVVELDGGLAQLRSGAPLLRGDARLYYEVLLQQDGTTTVRRYDAPRSATRREQVGFTLTHEALAKLVGDLTALA